jgi:CheY-like chemotaxis protein
VRDNGVGMDELTLRRIFEPFFSTKFTGRGLGLSAVMGIMRSHGGAIHIETGLGRGSAFTVLFPASEKALEAVPSRGSDSVPWTFGRGTILVIDDEESLRKVARASLELAGYDVLTASDGPEGIEIFQRARDQIRAVIVDLTMPIMRGDEVLRRLREVRADVRALVLSGYMEHEVMRLFESDPPDGFLQKPFRADQLTTKIKSIVDPATGGDSPTGR